MKTVTETVQYMHSDTGTVRERNEDGLIALPDQGIWAVCDGMGGHHAGDYASQHIVGRLRRECFPERLGSRVRAIERCLRECNRHLVDYAERHEFPYVGSTVVVLCLQDRRATVTWVGDSRAYRLRDDRLRLISRDHNVAEEFADFGARIVDDYPSAITRAVGGTSLLKVDMVCLESRPGDIWLLCSDGVSGTLGPESIRGILISAGDPAVALVREAIHCGSRDNCTAVVVGVGGEG